MTENKTDRPSLAVTLTAVATLITALGGLIYAIKSENFSKKNSEISTQNRLTSAETSTVKTYHGNVGRLTTTFSLTFNRSSGEVSGSYFYDKKSEQVYTLSGKMEGGNLYLKEFTKGTFTARCVLQQAADGCFSGTMYNNDRRTFAMNICE